MREELFDDIIKKKCVNLLNFSDDPRSNGWRTIMWNVCQISAGAHQSTYRHDEKKRLKHL